MISTISVISQVLFAFGNGYVSSTAFSLGPEQVSDELKGKAGSSISFFLICGIFSGTTLASLIMANYAS